MLFRSILSTHLWLADLWTSFASLLSGVRWPRLQALINGGVYYRLREADHDRIRQLLSESYLIVLTRRSSHLTTYLITVASKVVTGRPSHYTHALMNVEGDVQNVGFKLIEATVSGVHYSTFMQVLDCDSVALLKPRGVAAADWSLVLEAVKNEYGYSYDTLFDLTDAASVSCVEMIYQGLKKLPNWREEFRELVQLIEQNGNDLTPQMLYDCGDLELVYEVRR